MDVPCPGIHKVRVTLLPGVWLLLYNTLKNFDMNISQSTVRAWQGTITGRRACIHKLFMGFIYSQCWSIHRAWQGTITALLTTVCQKSNKEHPWYVLLAWMAYTKYCSNFTYTSTYCRFVKAAFCKASATAVIASTSILLLLRLDKWMIEHHTSIAG